MDNAILAYLERRRSVHADQLGEPGPSASEMQTILRIGARVPDHKKLAPWRFILFEGAAREQFGALLAETCRLNEPDASAGRLETERKRFLRSPIVVGVVSSPKRHPAVPEWEQELSAGAVCMNIVHAATALGYDCHWLTEWYAYDARIRAALGLAGHEKIAGFIHIGTGQERPQERERPDLAAITTVWTGGV